MVFIIFLVFNSVDSKGGYYYAEPKYCKNYSNDYPDTVESYFYLQQTSKWTVRFNGELHIKKRLGPMKGELELLGWTGKSFKKLSGGPKNDVNKTLCVDSNIYHLLQTLEPKTGLNKDECVFIPGNYTCSIDYDAHLHAVTPYFNFGPARIDFYDLELYNFIPKD